MNGGLVLGGLLFVPIGAYLFARSDRLTARQFELNRRVLRRVIGDAWTSRLLSPRFERANVAYARASGVAVVILGAVLLIAGLIA